MFNVECIACTKFAALAPRFTGGTSAISSSIIIFIISRSESKLRTVYHRIMFGMSVADIMLSVATGLSTLPMPKELSFKHEPYDGTRLGNTQTCEAQAFFYVFGLNVMFSYNAMLFVYNTCAITFQMREQHIVKFVEPFLHLIPLGMGLGIAIPPLVNELYNPTTWDAWCSISAGTAEVYTEQVLRLRNLKNMDSMVIILVVTFFSIILICSILILWRVIRVERELLGPKIKRRGELLMSNNQEKANKSLQNSKVIAKQALAYLLSFMITAGVLFIRGLIDEPNWMIFLSFALMPLQGFFNALIFISHKVYNYRRVYSDVSRWETLKILFKKDTQDEPVLFSRISLVRGFANNDREMDVEVSDEKGNREILHILKSIDNVPPSHSGGEAFVDDEESKRSIGEMDHYPSWPVGHTFSKNNDDNKKSSLDFNDNDNDNDLSFGGEKSNPDINDNTSSFGISKAGLSGFSSELSSLERTISPGHHVPSHAYPPPSLGTEDGVSIDKSNENKSLFSLPMWRNNKKNTSKDKSTDTV